MRDKIDQNKNELNIYNKKIYSYLLSGINCLHVLSIKNDELNRIALSKDDKHEKYGYTWKILKEKMTEKNDISSFFENSLQEIDNICLSEISKDEKVNDFINKILKSDDQ